MVDTMRRMSSWRLSMDEIRRLRPDWPEQLVQDYFSRNTDADSFRGALDENGEELQDHLEDLNNPHQVTHAQLSDITPDQHHAQAHDTYGADQLNIDKHFRYDAKIAGKWYLVGDSISTPNGPDVYSWNNLLNNANALSYTNDSQNGRSISRPGTAYVYAAPPATDNEIAIIELGSNDSGGIDLGGGVGPGGQPSDITEADFKAALTELITKFQNDGYRVVVILAFWNGFTESTGDPTWDQATTLIRQYQRDVCTAQGVTDVWDISLSYFADGLHPDQRGHQLLRTDMYGRMVAIAGDEYAHPYFHFNTPYVVGQEYRKGDSVLDGGWTMVANQDTTSRAAPQATGSAFYLYEGTSPTAQTTVKQVMYGVRYVPAVTFNLAGYRVYTTTDQSYQVFVVRDPLGGKVIDSVIEFTASSDGWQSLSVDSVIVDAGEAFDIVVIATAPDPAPTTFTIEYDYQMPNNVTAPASGEIIHANKGTDTLRISKNNYDDQDVSAQLAQLQVGDIINGANMSWLIQSVTDQGTFIDFAIAPATQGSPQGAQDFIFETPVAQPVTLVSDTNYWSSQSDISGLYIEDGEYENIAVNQNAYGIDLLVQQITRSDHWDVMAPGSSVGGGSALNRQTFASMATLADDFTGGGNPNQRLDRLEDILVQLIAYLRTK